ncbi:MAG: serine hydroxymethyltransferase [Candidatus Firestonebacteria bacterium RIFOXYC2_FULL_39_67]|nr:MAG: serine hydroxymethyltransferase [Candidatus Firestonebacteria bacterium RIFOXYD2_FULL_39_29]OGF55103.1 MAG: serine hydroxymethyltransferase [Candidatus Firestonebacteria bacterium RIFOXYC2_FULL_39_67]
MFKGYFGDVLKKEDPVLEKLIIEEFKRENTKLQMIASENYASKAVMAAQGSVLTNKYAEGYPYKKFYEGCQYASEIEQLAIDRMQKLFNAEHVNVQPHSGSSANLAVFIAVLQAGDVVMGMDLSCGGHLTHGAPANISGKTYKIVSYGVNRDTNLLDYDEIRQLALKHRPKLIIAGASAYPRIIDFKKFKDIAAEAGAYFMADIAHIAGLIAGKVHPDASPYADFVTGTTHKTLSGPRGGFIISRKEFAKKIDSAVFPGIQGGPLVHVIAAKAVCFKQAMTPEFRKYQQQVVKNAKVLAAELVKRGFKLVTGGTDNHLMLVDLRGLNITGRDAALVLDDSGITINKNGIPYDTMNVWHTSGIRIGTPAITTRGMKEGQMPEIAELIDRVLKNIKSPKVHKEVAGKVKQLCKKFPVKI